MPPETDQIARQLANIERWMATHDERHVKQLERMHDDHLAMLSRLNEHMEDDEHRLTALESALGTRTWIGGLGMLVQAAFTAFMNRPGANS